MLLLQCSPQQTRKWLPAALWEHCLETLEIEETKVILQVKALQGAGKLGEFTAFFRELSFVIMPGLRALLKVANRAHPYLQAYLID